MTDVRWIFLTIVARSVLFQKEKYMRINQIFFLSACAYLSLFYAHISAFSSGNDGLVNMRAVNPRIKIDMRFASNDNPLGAPLYPSGECYLVTEVAYKLSAVQRELEKIGYGLKIWDAYRPYNQQLFLSCHGNVNFDKIDSSLYFIEHQNGNSRGTSVDVTLVCLSGCEPMMPTDFGADTPGTPRDSVWLSANAYHNSQLLEKKMEQFGFVPSPIAWWHFDYRSESCYPILDVSIEALSNQ